MPLCLMVRASGASKSSLSLSLTLSLSLSLSGRRNDFPFAENTRDFYYIPKFLNKSDPACWQA
eukprot:COSAG05_NODE_1632_length_4371_cov_247.693820_4_plen_63_part_00